MTPAEAFVETLAAHGVTEIFGSTGSAFTDAREIFAPAGIRLIPVVHELGAAHMADGYARASGRPGVVIGQNGISTCVTAIAAAFWAHSPVVVITPEAGTMFPEFTKYRAHVNHPNRMAELTARAFDRARSEMGPAQLSIPRDHFSGEIETEIPRPRRPGRGPGDTRGLDEAAGLLARADFPVIVAGGGVVFSGGIAECRELAERLGAPVVNSYQHDDSFPASHPQWCGPLGYQGSTAAMRLIAEADVVLALGTRLGPFGTLPQHGMDYWPGNAKIIQVDADHTMLGLVKKIDVGIRGDAREAAAALTQRLRPRTLACDATRGRRAGRIREEKAMWERQLSAWTPEKQEHNRLHPRQVLRELAKAMPGRAMVSTGIGTINSVAHSYLRFEEPRSFFPPMSFGNCGHALPRIIGAKVARPERPAIAYAGDGAWGSSMAEVATAVRHGIPVTAVVFHRRPRGAGTARAMGADGIVVDALDEVGPALRTAVDAQMTSGRTTVLEVLCSPEPGDPFRRDARRKPVRPARRPHESGAA
ncbi:sulfoacetaldehyde acetyltransferase [Amycolatopsis thermalba]|uniref:Sulfoacetaldehyde acetyltransferase n=2 Tax=Amycolatopsis TaxID=1813 RepID=A0ABY4NZI1_9PSEU|nr:sulfoacetaldehyde acetyltransferase [Amycolatopsis thermalba]UQS25412.1 sulfoacetaldehyde acetyltransferase [Amycolatopsis thermalba]